MEFHPEEQSQDGRSRHSVSVPEVYHAAEEAADTQIRHSASDLAAVHNRRSASDLEEPHSRHFALDPEDLLFAELEASDHSHHSASDSETCHVVGLVVAVRSSRWASAAEE